MMPSGIAMLIKTMLPGFNPEDFGRTVESIRTGAAETIKLFEARLDRIEATQRQQTILLVAIARTLGGVAGEIAECFPPLPANLLNRATNEAAGVQPGGAQPPNS